MKLLVFRIVYLHTKNELPVNYETVWSRTTRVGRACTYAQKFRNELFTKFILYLSWKWESLENSSCAMRKKMTHRWTLKRFDLGQLASENLVHTLKSFTIIVYWSQTVLFMRNDYSKSSICAQKWVTGKWWNCLISVNSRRQTSCFRSRV